MDERLLDEAIAWQRALAEANPDWEGFSAWLEADPDHRRAFDEISLADRMIDDRITDLRSVLTAAPADDRMRGPGRRRLMIGSIAAALALAIGLPLARPAHQDTIYATASGETRRIALAEGTSIDLAPSSKLVVLGSDPTALRLAQGEAYFAVRHDPGRVLSIQAGRLAISDVGTKFAVTLADDTVRIGVADGHVAVDGDRLAIRLSAGEQLFAMAGAPPRKYTVAVADVGSWRRGQLVYTDAPLSIVVADISRYSGQKIVMNPKLKGRRFSGVLAIAKGSELLVDISRLMALRWQVEGDHLRLDDGAAR